MRRTGLNVFILFAVTLALVSAAALVSYTLWGLMLCLINVFAVVTEALLLRFSRPLVLKRKLPADNWWERVLPPAMALLAVASAVLSVLDSSVLKLSVLPPWCALLGAAVLLAAFMIIAQAVKTDGPHAAQKYAEPAPEQPERGPYDVVRHPVMLSVLLGGLSIPLILGSGIGFIPAGLMAAAVIARVSLEDDWRFNQYEWYYDYTKEVSYRLIPFIW